METFLSLQISYANRILTTGLGPLLENVPFRSAMLWLQVHESAFGRLCCKSLKTPAGKFPARRRNKPRSLIDVASGSLPKSPVSLSPGDEVPHMFTQKPRLQLEKFAINGAKRLLQHNPLKADKSADVGLIR